MLNTNLFRMIKSITKKVIKKRKQENLKNTIN